MPPTQISGSPWQSAWNSTTSPKKAPTASTFAVGVGDLIVVEANNAGAEGSFSTPTNAAATSPASITWTQKGNVGTSGVNSRAACWEGDVTAAGNVQVSVAQGGTAVDYGIIVWAFPASGHGGVGQTIATTGNSTAPSATPGAAWTAHSTVCCANADWNAASWGATRSYRTNLGAATERNYAAVDGNYTSGAWEHSDSGATPSSGAVGFTTPTMKWSLTAVEVLPPAGGSTPVSREWTASYDLSAGVSREWTASYDVQASVLREWALAYDMATFVSREWAASYDLAAFVSRNWELDYDLSVSVSREWTASYDLLAAASSVSNEWTLPYDVAVSVAREWVAAYDISNNVAAEWQLVYILNQPVSSDVALKYDVVASGPVSGEWTLRYSIGGLPSDDIRVEDRRVAESLYLLGLASLSPDMLVQDLRTGRRARVADIADYGDFVLLDFPTGRAFRAQDLDL